MAINNFVPTTTTAETPTQAGLQAYSGAVKNVFQMPLLQQKLAQQQAQTHINQVQAAFASPQAQALLAKSQADAGVAQASRQVAVSTIGAHVANVKAITAQNQYLAAKNHADAITAQVGANVATKTQPAQVQAVLAKTAEKQAHAKKAAITAAMQRNTILAERAGLMQPTIVASITHPFNAQVHPSPAVKGGQASANAAGNQYANSVNKNTVTPVTPGVPGVPGVPGNNSPANSSGLFMTPQQMNAYYSNPNVPINEKVAKLRNQAENTYDHNHKAGSWKKLTNSQRNNFLKQYAQKYGIK